MKGDIDENYLSAQLRLEVKNAYKLTSVPSTFYKDVRNYLDDLKSKIEIETTKKNSRMAGKLIMDLENSEKVFRGIIERRIAKILMAKALEEKDLLEGLLTPEEQVFYEGLTESVKEFFNQLLQGGIIDTNESKSIKNEIKQDTQEEISNNNKETYEEMAIVYIKQNIENISVMGEKISLRKEDIVTLPSKYADIIDKQGLGKKIKSY